MAHRKTLTAAQLELLRWIADGCPDGVMEGTSHRISAAALRSRGLVKISGRGRAWRATTTQAGRDYLDAAAKPDADPPRQPNVSVTEQLVADVIAAGGSLRVPQRHYRGTGLDWANRARLAERHGKLPAGKRLEVSRISGGELRIALVDAPAGTDVAVEPVPVPERAGRYHLAVRAFRDAADTQQISRAALPRASLILQSLVTAAEERGFVAGTTERTRGNYALAGQARSGRVDITLSIDGHTTPIRIIEEGLADRSHWDRQTVRWDGYGSPGARRVRQPRSAYETNATGRLTLEVPARRQATRASRWSDRRDGTLEEKLPLVLRELRVRAAEQRHLDDQAQEQRDVRRTEWEAAVDLARQRHAEAQRASVLADEVERWEEAERIRTYCAAAAERHPDNPGTSAWVAWARDRADRIDPLATAPGAPAFPAASPGDLKPFLDGWDPYDPEREYPHRW
jgi:hypothetical protein